MSAKTVSKPAQAETLNYHELLKDARKTISVSLPAQTGTPDYIRERNEAALRAVGWRNQEYTITPAKHNYSYYDGNSTIPAKAIFERPYTKQEIDDNGERLYAALLKAQRKAAIQRAKDIAKLRALQRKLNLPLYEGD